MAPKKGLEDASKVELNTSSAASNGSGAESPQLKAFWTLPYEIQYRIITTACGPPVLHRWTVVGRSTDCTSTMLALQRTSRMLYVLVTPLLYKYVRLVRPSIMRSFQQSISVRPSLGRLVDALHIGADNALPKEWWPMRRLRSSSGEPTRRLFTLNLAPSVDGENPQWGGCSRYEHDMDNFDKDDPKASTLDAAFQAAELDLDVRLQSKFTVYSDRPLDGDAWTLRVLELQAALELYALELYRCEHRAAEAAQKEGAAMTRKRKKAEEDGKLLVSYPGLLVSESGAVKRGFFTITTLQIRERLASPGAPTDVFNHPYFFAQAGFRWEAKGPNDELHSGGHLFEEEYDVEDIPDVFDSNHYFRTCPKLPSLSSPDPLRLERCSTDTLGGSLTIARSILTLTSHVKALSLTGLFEFILAGEQPPCPQFLDSLTVGPDQPIKWNILLRLDYEALRCLKKIRVCRLPEASFEDDLSGERPTLPYLEKVQMCQLREYARGSPQHIVYIIERLLGLNKPAAEPQSKQTADEDEYSYPSILKQKDESRYIEARLHPTDVATILAAAPSPEVAQAWKDGSEAPGIRHRFKVCEHEAFRDGARPTWRDGEAMQALYDEGRRWWEGEEE